MEFIGAIFTWLYENIVVPIITGFGEMFTWLYENIIKPIGDGIGAVFGFIGDIIGYIIGGINAALKGFGEVFNWLYMNIIVPIGAFIGGIFENIGNTVTDVFTGIGNFIRDTFNAIVGFVKGPVNAIISFINTMIDGLNGIKIKIPDWVPEWGGKSVGFNLSKIPQLADGGTITTGGTVMVGEEGPELLSLPKGASVTPLNGRNNAAAGNTIIYNAAPNVSIDSEQELFTAMRRAKVVAGW
jgi:phage-related protein